ncbi:MAG: hypothetical protein AAB316_22455, partial [Bacteroidota bacterium]
SSVSFDAFQIKEGISKQAAEKKIELLEHFSSFLVKLMKAGVIQSREDKVALMELASKIKRQAEILEIQIGKVKLEDLKVAAENFAKKTATNGFVFLEKEK